MVGGFLSLRDPRRPPRASGILGLFDFKITIEALKKTRAKTQTQTQKHTNSRRSASEWHPQKPLRIGQKQSLEGRRGGWKMSSWSSLGRFVAPCGPRVSPRSAPNRSRERPGDQNQFSGRARGRPRPTLLPFFVIRGRPGVDFDLHFDSPGEGLGHHFAFFHKIGEV